jgi:ComEC/Rec2-related protein
MKNGRAPLLLAALFFAAGVACARWDGLPVWVPLLLALLCGPLAWWKRSTTGSILLALACWGASCLYAKVRMETVPAMDLGRRAGEAPQSLEVVLELAQFPKLKTDETGRQSLHFEASVLSFVEEGRETPASGRIVCLLKNPEGAQLSLDCGHRLRTYGFLSRPEPPANPGSFDYRSWLATRGITHRFSFEGNQTQVLRAYASNPLIEASNRLRKHMLKVLSLGVETDLQTTALTSAMLFGHQEGLGDEIEESFRSTGTIHLFAVSGQNIAIVSAFLLLLLRVAGLVPWRWGWCLLLPLTLFCLTTGSQPSAVRAVCMAGMILVGWFIGRPPNLMNAAGATALACLFWDPRQLFDLGFQLSFLVVFGLAGLAMPLYERCYARLAPDPWIPLRLLPRWRIHLDKAARAFCLLFAASAAAWLCSSPLILWHFSLFAPVTLIANLLVVPLATGVVYISALTVLLSPLGALLPTLFNQVNWLLLKTVLGSVSLLAQLPGGHFYLPVHSGHPDAGHLQVIALDSDTAAPTLLRFKGHNLLLDTGSADGWLYTVDPARRYFGINRWDSLFLTQASGSHLGGALALARQMDAAHWIESGKRSRSPIQHRLLEALEEKSIPKTFLRRGDRWSGDPLSITCLWPPANAVKNQRLEDAGLVLLIVFEGKKILWAGDVSPAIEKQLLASESSLAADILIQGEHSKERNLSEAWLRRLRPRWLVRPGRGYYPDRSFSPLFWNLSRELDITVLPLDRTGAITFDIGREDKQIVYSTFKAISP